MLPIVSLSARTCFIERNEGKRQGSRESSKRLSGMYLPYLAINQSANTVQCSRLLGK